MIDPLHRSPSLTPASLRETGALVHDHDSPLTSIFRGTASDGTDVAIQMIASHLVALAPNVSRVVAQLQRLQDLDAGPQGRVVWAELLADGRIGVARRWLDSDPVVSVVRSSGKSPRQLTLAASVFSRELAEWHAQDLLHGAIAPTGLRMERNTGRLFAEDLGIMAALVSGGARSLQIIAGTQALAYASPELTESGIVDRRTDIYALGTTLFELLTGSPPFGGRTTAAIMASVLIPGTDEVANIDEATGASALVSALLRAIEKAPDDRWTTADQFADALLEETLRPSSLTDLREGDTRAHVPGILSRLALIALTARNRFTGRS